MGIEKTINFLGDKWLEEEKLKDLFPDFFSLTKQPNNFANSNFRNDAYSLTFRYNRSISIQRQKTPLYQMSENVDKLDIEDDEAICLWDRKDNFTVSSCYKVLDSWGIMNREAQVF